MLVARAGDRRGLADAALLGLVVLATFSSALRCGWIWDDDAHVTRNPTLSSLAGLRAIWTDRTATPQYYPLVHTTFWIERRLWGTATDAAGVTVPRPFGFHLDNVLLHAAGAIVLWRLLRTLELSGAWFAAALWAVHPVTVESVAWVTERKNVLSLALALGSALAYWGWLRHGRAWRLAAAGLLFLGALASKTVVASLPVVLVLLLWWKRERLDARAVVPLVVAAGCGGWLGWLTAAAERAHVGAEGAPWAHGLVERVLIAGRAVFFYVGQLVWPLGLTFNYPRFAADPGRLASWAWPAAAAGIVAALLVLQRQIGRGPLVAALSYLGVLFPALGFLNVYPHRYAFVADHFQHHAAVALLALGAAGLARLPFFRLAPDHAGDGPLGSGPRAALASWAVLLLPLAVLSWRHGGDFSDSETLWRQVLERNPRSFLAYHHLAQAEAERGRTDAAIELFQRALDIEPELPETLNNLGQLLLNRGRLEQAEPLLARAAELAPSLAEPQANLGQLFRLRGQPERAVEHYRRAIALGRAGPPPEVTARLGRLLAELGRPEEALEVYRAGLADPRSAAFSTLGAIWILATHEDGTVRSAEEAVRLAESLRRTLRSPGVAELDAAAAAYAEAGRFAEAANFASQALERARREQRDELARSIEGRLERYQAGEPCRTRRGFPE